MPNIHYSESPKPTPSVIHTKSLIQIASQNHQQQQGEFCSAGHICSNNTSENWKPDTEETGCAMRTWSRGDPSSASSTACRPTRCAGPSLAACSTWRRYPCPTTCSERNNETVRRSDQSKNMIITATCTVLGGTGVP